MPRRTLTPIALILAASAIGCGGDGESPFEARAEASEGQAEDRATSAAAPGLAEHLAQAAEGGVCPAVLPSPDPLPRVRPEHETLDYWLARVAAEQGDLDEVLLAPERIADHNAALFVNQDVQPLGLYDLTAPIDVAVLQTSMDERLDWLRNQFTQALYVEADGQPLTTAELARFEPVTLPADLEGELRVALDVVHLRCGPRLQGFYTPTLDLRFDRNNCSAAHPQEVVQVLHTWPNGLRLARTAYSIGFIAPDAALSAPIPDDQVDAWVQGPAVRLTEAASVSTPDGPTALPLGTRLPVAGDGVLAATATGFHEADPPPAAEPTTQPLTRRAVLTEAFRYLGMPYGWGDANGGQDCSRFLHDLFAAFGLELPRHSAYQAEAGTFSIDVTGLTNETERQLLIDAAARRGVVLLHFPGHIMLYLGRNDEGRPMAIHSFAEYLEPCPAGTHPERPLAEGQQPETLFTVDRVLVSDLELGRGTSRTAFIERITRIVVIGPSPGLELQGIARMRPAAPVEVPPRSECSDWQEVAIFQLPMQPNSREPLRVLATSERDLGPVELTLVGPDGERYTLEPQRFGGPPWSWLVTLEAPAVGNWRAALGDGSRLEACWPFRVTRNPQPHRTIPEFLAGREAPPPGEAEGDGAGLAEVEGADHASAAAGADPTVDMSDPALLEGTPLGEPAHPEWGPVWEHRRTWGKAVENLYAAWVESLFAYPADEEITWTSLHDLLSHRERNLLFNYLGQGEDELLDEDRDPVLYMQPDCADLPYLLRAYFAWKMRLPYAFRRCARGAAGRPPGCLEINTNLMPRTVEDDAGAFAWFANREVRRAVHSASGRTHPEYEFSDFYPVALTRESLPPGTVFADPYGHLIVLVRWEPQGLTSYGRLIGADAQPDGTIGRRTFWRGTFLFNPDTTDVGAGFKHYRPIARLPDTLEPLTAVDNETLRQATNYRRFSLQQYEGSVDDWYDTMEALINPRPLDPHTMLVSLVDALEESVVRRIVSVDVGEDFLRSRPQTVEMPEGYAIFETVGAWEDYATPSRDMRLLIAIDTVMGFPDAVRRRPEQYGLQPGPELEPAVAELEARLDEELRARNFSYVRSDGTPWTVTLRETVDRAPAFEMAYNPNDCIETRWGAPPGSTEAATCQRHAPTAQRALMEQYRSWFSTRTRPPR